MNPTRRVGQANFFSFSSQSIGSKGSSIVNKLASRSITKNGLRIHEYQHVGFKLHLVWHVFNKHNNTSIKCFERIFPEFNDLYDFCKHLKDVAYEGLCDCVCSCIFEWMDDKLTTCTLEHSQARIRRYVSVVQNRKPDYYEC